MKFTVLFIVVSIVACYGKSITCWGSTTDNLLYTQNVQANFEFFASARRVINYEGVSRCEVVNEMKLKLFSS